MFPRHNTGVFCYWSHVQVNKSFSVKHLSIHFVDVMLETRIWCLQQFSSPLYTLYNEIIYFLRCLWNQMLVPLILVSRRGCMVLSGTPMVLLFCFVQRRRLLKELGDQKIPFLGPSDRGFQQLVSRTSHFEEPTAAHF